MDSQQAKDKIRYFLDEKTDLGESECYFILKSLEEEYWSSIDNDVIGETDDDDFGEDTEEDTEEDKDEDSQEEEQEPKPKKRIGRPPKIRKPKLNIKKKEDKEEDDEVGA